MEIVLVVLLVAFIIWLLAQFIAALSQAAKIALIITLSCLVLLAFGIHLDA